MKRVFVEKLRNGDVVDVECMKKIWSLGYTILIDGNNYYHGIIQDRFTQTTTFKLFHIEKKGAAYKTLIFMSVVNGVPFKIVDPAAEGLAAQVGISKGRAMELKNSLDAMVKEFREMAREVRACDLFSKIASFCNNNEELVYCTILHTDYCTKRGMQIVFYG